MFVFHLQVMSLRWAVSCLPIIVVTAVKKKGFIINGHEIFPGNFSCQSCFGNEHHVIINLWKEDPPLQVREWALLMSHRKHWLVKAIDSRGEVWDYHAESPGRTHLCRVIGRRKWMERKNSRRFWKRAISRYCSSPLCSRSYTGERVQRAVLTLAILFPWARSAIFWLLAARYFFAWSVT